MEFHNISKYCFTDDDSSDDNDDDDDDNNDDEMQYTFVQHCSWTSVWQCDWSWVHLWFTKRQLLF